MESKQGNPMTYDRLKAAMELAEMRNQGAISYASFAIQLNILYKL